MEQKVTPPWTKGLVISLILIVYGLALYFAGQAQNKSLSWIQFIVLIVGVIVADNSFAKQKNGNVTFGNVFAHGFKVTATIIVIMVIYSVIAFKFLFPEMIDAIMNQARTDMEKKGNLTEEQITQGVEMGKKFFIPFAIGGIIVMFGICGAIASLIGAGVAKKNPNYNPLEQS
ncbi:MAG: DUF4199 domain-containing protein [Bacteroidota bacterium]